MTTGHGSPTLEQRVSPGTLKKILLVSLLALAVGSGFLPALVVQLIGLLLVGLFAVVVATFCINKPRVALICYLVALYFITAVTNDRMRLYGFGQLFTFIPKVAGYAGDGILVLLLGITLLRYLLLEKQKAPQVYDVLILLLFLVAGLSWKVNSVPLFTGVAALRLMIVMISGYILLRYGPYELSFFETIFKVLLIISLLQFPLILFQRFIGVYYLGWGDDLVAGSFSRYGKLVFFQLTFFALGVAAYMQKTLPTSFNKYLRWAAVGAVASLALANARIVFFFIPLITAILLARYSIHHFFRVIKIAILAGLLFAGALYVFVSLYGGESGGDDYSRGGQELLFFMQNPIYVYYYFFGQPEMSELYGGKLARGTAIIYLLDHLHRYPGGLWLGVGPGMASEFKFAIASSPSQVSEFVKLGTSVTQAAAFLGEIGLIGLTLSLLIVLYGLRILKKKRFVIGGALSPQIAMIHQAYPAILVVFLLMQFYGRVWVEAESAFLFWFLTVYLLRAGEERNPVRISVQVK